MAWSVYLLRCADDSLYTGIAVDVRKRLEEHQGGRAGAKYLRGRGPLELIFEQEVGDRSLASKIEYRIKQLPRSCKADLAGLRLRIDQWLESLPAE